MGVEAPAKPVAPEQLSAGVRVHVKGFKQAVVFRRHDGRMAEVEAGPLRMKVPLADILSIEGDDGSAKPKAARDGSPARDHSSHAAER